MSVDRVAAIEQKKLAVAEEKEKEHPDFSKIAALQDAIKENEKQLSIEKAAQNVTIALPLPAEDEKKKNAQEHKAQSTDAELDAAVESTAAFLAKKEVMQIKNVSEALSNGTGQIVGEDGKSRDLTSKDIDAMQANALSVAADPINQEQQQQRQEQAKKLKEALQNPDIPKEEREAKAAQQSMLLEGIGEFKGAQAKAMHQNVTHSLREQDFKLNKVAATQEKRVQQIEKTSDALSDGTGKIAGEDGKERNVTSRDINEMEANAHKIVADPNSAGEDLKAAQAKVAHQNVMKAIKKKEVNLTPKEEATQQVEKTSGALSDGTGQIAGKDGKERNVTSRDINEMEANAHTIVADPNSTGEDLQAAQAKVAHQSVMQDVRASGKDSVAQSEGERIRDTLISMDEKQGKGGNASGQSGPDITPSQQAVADKNVRG